MEENEIKKLRHKNRNLKTKIINQHRKYSYNLEMIKKQNQDLHKSIEMEKNKYVEIFAKLSNQISELEARIQRSNQNKKYSFQIPAFPMQKNNTKKRLHELEQEGDQLLGKTDRVLKNCYFHEFNNKLSFNNASTPLPFKPIKIQLPEPVNDQPLKRRLSFSSLNEEKYQQTNKNDSKRISATLEISVPKHFQSYETIDSDTDKTSVTKFSDLISSKSSSSYQKENMNYQTNRQSKENIEYLLNKQTNEVQLKSNIQEQESIQSITNKQLKENIEYKLNKQTNETKFQSSNTKQENIQNQTKIENIQNQTDKSVDENLLSKINKQESENTQKQEIVIDQQKSNEIIDPQNHIVDTRQFNSNANIDIKSNLKQEIHNQPIQRKNEYIDQMNVRHFVYEDSSSEEEASETIAHFKPQLEEESMQEQEEINDQSNAPSEINTTLFAGMQDYKDNDEELSLEFQSDGFPSNTLDKTKTESSTLKQNENDLENESFEIEFPDDLEDDDTEGWGA